MVVFYNLSYAIYANSLLRLFFKASAASVGKYMTSSKKMLSVFSLVMINVIAVDSLRTLPLSASLGLSLIGFYAIAAIAFLLPVALVAAELATAYPNTGGLYVWVREAFGKRAGFITIWLQWIYNVVWYPTIMAFIAATFSYLFDLHLANNKIYLLTTSLSLFWLFTVINCFGMRFSTWISIIGALFGTLLPMVGIIFLGIIWFFKGGAIAIEHPASWVPHFNSDNLSLFSIILFGLLGMEMSATHAEEVRNPQRDYPRAILISVIIIFLSLVLSSLAIVMVVPPSQLSVVSGLIDAFSIFFNYYHLSFLTPLIALMIILGGLSGVSTWIIGPAKGLLVAAKDGSLPLRFSKINRYQVPVPILILQGILFTFLSVAFLIFDSVNAAYLFLSDLCAQLALLVYIFMFSAAIKLRYSQPTTLRSYAIPGGKIGIWVVSMIGIICCVSAMLAGFIPPKQMPHNNIIYFESFLMGGMFLFVFLPWFFAKKLA